ncbi:hypothetical protein [Streptomyces sp. NPDC020951]|uniref:hypothetical protein n=1 Tax=Streptomyces sp. NPDC020951 TaxID=3365104 RepID=UPI0037BAD404
MSDDAPASFSPATAGHRRPAADGSAGTLPSSARRASESAGDGRRVQPADAPADIRQADIRQGDIRPGLPESAITLGMRTARGGSRAPRVDLPRTGNTVNRRQP